MAWSTRQVAELAGTTLKAVRHYHKVGLLPEPDRDTNGYKQYGIPHLVRLLRIRRLTDLGVSLTQIAAMGAADEHPEEALRVLDAELAATIERLQRVRAELAMIMQQSLPTDLPPALAAMTAGVSAADRALMVVYGRVLGPEGQQAIGRFVADYRNDAADDELEALPEDADEATRVDLAERVAPHLYEALRQHPDLITTRESTPGGTRRLDEIVGSAISEVYNAAQLDVYERAGRLIQEMAAADVADAGSAGAPEVRVSP